MVGILDVWVLTIPKPRFGSQVKLMVASAHDVKDVKYLYPAQSRGDSANIIR